jgi:hypothetical protein
MTLTSWKILCLLLFVSAILSHTGAFILNSLFLRFVIQDHELSEKHFIYKINKASKFTILGVAFLVLSGLYLLIKIIVS